MFRLEKLIEASARLPRELRDKLVKIRELDLVVRDATDKQETQIFMFFQNATTLNLENRGAVFQSLLSAFESILQIADEKVNIVERLADMFSEQLEQLDRQINTCKIKLENDNSGFTDLIQDRVFRRNNYLAKNSRALKDKLRNVKRFKLTKKKRSMSTPALRVCCEREFNNKPLQQEVIYDWANENKNNKGPVMSNAKLTTTDDLGIYCFCNRLAYGDMVACDNKLCPHEWFHYACVNMTMAPAGKWYCPKCIECRICLERI